MRRAHSTAAGAGREGAPRAHGVARRAAMVVVTVVDMGAASANGARVHAFRGVANARLSVVVTASFGDDEALRARRGECDMIKMMVFLRWRQSALSSSSLHAWRSPHARVSLLVKNQAAARRRLEHRRAVGARRNRDKVVHERVGNVLTPVRGRTFVGHRSCVCGKQKIRACDVSARSRRRTRGRKRARDEAKSLRKFTQTNDTYLG